jgi:hypothetical protein
MPARVVTVIAVVSLSLTICVVCSAAARKTGTKVGYFLRKDGLTAPLTPASMTDCVAAGEVVMMM